MMYLYSCVPIEFNFSYSFFLLFCLNTIYTWNMYQHMLVWFFFIECSLFSIYFFHAYIFSVLPTCTPSTSGHFFFDKRMWKKQFNFTKRLWTIMTTLKWKQDYIYHWTGFSFKNHIYLKIIGEYSRH